LNFARFASTEVTAIQTATSIFSRRSRRPHRSLVIAYVGHRVSGFIASDFHLNFFTRVALISPCVRCIRAMSRTVWKSAEVGCGFSKSLAIHHACSQPTGYSGCTAAKSTSLIEIFVQKLLNNNNNLRVRF
jgi:hypothetical protein